MFLLRFISGLIFPIKVFQIWTYLSSEKSRFLYKQKDCLSAVLLCTAHMLCVI
jgi:hypothetical protein